MLVRMLVGLSGSEYCLVPGDKYDFPQDEALRLIYAGYAVPSAEQQIERAVAMPAAERRGRRTKNVASANRDDSTN